MAQMGGTGSVRTAHYRVLLPICMGARPAKVCQSLIAHDYTLYHDANIWCDIL